MPAALPSPTPDHTHPYEALTPDVVLDALAQIGLYGDGRLLAGSPCLDAGAVRPVGAPQRNRQLLVTKWLKGPPGGRDQLSKRERSRKR